jgi:SAM-dependent methyltransferase
VPDALFAHPRLAAVYDAFDAPRPDLPPYLALAAELGARTVLDVGCGTGVLVGRLLAAGFEPVGADPAAASLQVARARTPQARFVGVGAADLPALGVDLAVMTGNVAQVFVTDADWAAALAGVARAVRPGGVFVFETRRPAARDWENWPPGPQVRDVPGVGRVAKTFELVRVHEPLLTFRNTFTFDDGERVISESTLRFRELDELEATLTAAGFAVRDVRQAPDRPGLEFVVVAERVHDVRPGVARTTVTS